VRSGSWAGTLTSFSPLLKCTTLRLTVLTSTVSSPYTFSKRQWMSVGAICSAVRNSVTHFYVRRHFCWLLCCHYLSHDNQTDSTFVGRFNLYYNTTNNRLWSYRLTQRNRRHYIWNAPRTSNGNINGLEVNSCFFFVFFFFFFNSPSELTFWITLVESTKYYEVSALVCIYYHLELIQNIYFWISPFRAKTTKNWRKLTNQMLLTLTHWQ
jgi:hypothetical protein